MQKIKKEEKKKKLRQDSTQVVGCVDKTAQCTQHCTVFPKPTAYHSRSHHILNNNLSHFFNAYSYFINYYKLSYQLII